MKKIYFLIAVALFCIGSQSFSVKESDITDRITLTPQQKAQASLTNLVKTKNKELIREVLKYLYLSRIFYSVCSDERKSIEDAIDRVWNPIVFKDSNKKSSDEWKADRALQGAFNYITDQPDHVSFERSMQLYRYLLNEMANNITLDDSPNYAANGLSFDIIYTIVKHLPYSCTSGARN